MTNGTPVEREEAKVSAAKREVEAAELKVAAAKQEVAVAEAKYEATAEGSFQRMMAESAWRRAGKQCDVAIDGLQTAQELYKATVKSLADMLQHTVRDPFPRDRPPLHPNTVTNEHKLDQILEAVQKTDRATPQYSAAYVGNKVNKRLVEDGRFVIFEEKVGEESVLTAEQVEELSRATNEHHVVAYITPFLEEIVKDTASCSVFNSEEYKWIQTSSETSVYNEKPDLLIIHPAFANSKHPFQCERDEALKSMRRNTDKFGVLSQWRLRDFIGLTCEAKQKIDNGGFGEVINYGAHICFGEHGAVATRLMLFDKQTFWLVESVRGEVASVVTSRWLDHGSKHLLRDFVRQPALAKLLNDACEHFNLVVKSDSFLGAGAFGFVFRAQRVDGASVALKVALDTHAQRLETEKAKILRAKKECPDEVIGLEEDGFHTFEGGAALLLTKVGDHFSKLSPQSIVDSLQRLHDNGIIHGDARLENVVSVDGKPCWIDFADSDLLLDTPLLMQSEMDTLIGYVKERFDGYNAAR